MEKNINKILADLERYNVIADYYKKNSSRREPNRDYLIDIVDELSDISERQLPKGKKDLHNELLGFFVKISDYI